MLDTATTEINRKKCNFNDNVFYLYLSLSSVLDDFDSMERELDMTSVNLTPAAAMADTAIV